MPSETSRETIGIGETLVGHVARSTGDRAIGRQPFVEIEPFPESDLFFGERIVVRYEECGRAGVEPKRCVELEPDSRTGDICLVYLPGTSRDQESARETG